MYISRIIADALSQAGDFGGILRDIEALRARTIVGQFDESNPLQKDLEFMRFANEYPLSNGGSKDHVELYRQFGALTTLPDTACSEYELTNVDVAAAARLAYEDVGFLRFLRGFRASTSRPIVVVGNNRYGQFWFVEPLEEYLSDAGFNLRYDRVPSLYTHRLTVPPAFPRSFVQYLDRRMPHIVIADGSNLSLKSRFFDVMNYSKAHNSYANWYAVFNDIRANGDEATYRDSSSLPPEEIAELKKWHGFQVERRRLRPWVNSGPTYTVTTWAPRIKNLVRMGEDLVFSRRPVDIGGDEPLVVLANPIIYEMEGDDLPAVLKNAHFYHFNDPERKVREKVVFGFGSHGLETRVVGPTTDQFVYAAQARVKEEIRRLLNL